MRMRFWFELTAAIVTGVVVLALLGPLPAVVYTVAAVGFLGRPEYHRQHHGGCHRHYHH